MNRKTGGLLIVGLILAVLYFLNRKNIEVVSMQPFKVHTFSASGGELQGVIVLNNPNLLSSTIKTVHEKFYLNGILLGIIENDINQGIPGMKESQFPVSIRFSNADYQKALTADSNSSSTPVIMITGDIAFQNLFNSGKIEVKQQAVIANEK